MEKVRYGGMTYDLVVGGLDIFTEGKLIIKHQKGESSLETIKENAKAVTETDTIDLLDSEGNLIRSVEGYVYAGNIQEIENYPIQEKQVLFEDTEETEPSVETEEIRADVVAVTFKLPDVREELKKIKAIQDAMLVSMLEGEK